MSQSSQVKFVVNEWLPSFERKNLDLIAMLMHEDFYITTYPKSLGQQDQTKKQWLEQLANFFPLTTKCRTVVNSIIADAQGKVILHVTDNLTAAGISMTRESILVEHIVIDVDGRLKIKRAEMFTDSKAHLDFMQAFAAAIAKK